MQDSSPSTVAGSVPVRESRQRRPPKQFPESSPWPQPRIGCSGGPAQASSRAAPNSEPPSGSGSDSESESDAGDEMELDGPLVGVPAESATLQVPVDMEVNTEPVAGSGGGDEGLVHSLALGIMASVVANGEPPTKESALQPADQLAAHSAQPSAELAKTPTTIRRTSGRSNQWMPTSTARAFASSALNPSPAHVTPSPLSKRKRFTPALGDDMSEELPASTSGGGEQTMTLPTPKPPPTDAEFAAEPQAYGWGIPGMAEVQEGLEMDTLAAEAADAQVVWVQFCNYPHWPVRTVHLPAITDKNASGYRVWITGLRL